MESAAAVSAQKPPRGFRRVIRPPMVRTMRHPPLSVPRAIAAWAEKITHTGTRKVGRYFAENSTAAMMPMVFCASLRSEEHTSELQSQSNLVCRLLLEKKKTKKELDPHRTIKIQAGDLRQHVRGDAVSSVS